jgi:Ca2+-binding RTX toxin-like protein
MPIITTNQISTTSHGLTYPAASRTYTIIPNVIVAGASDSDGVFFEATDFNGVYSNFFGSVLANHGMVLSDENAAVNFDTGAGFSTLRNYSDGSLQGAGGVQILAANVKVFNDGDIFASQSDGIFIDFNIQNTLITNSGNISSVQSYGILSFGNFDNVVNTTTGVISGFFAGVELLSSAAHVTNSGMIQGQSGNGSGIGVVVTLSNSTVHNDTTGTIEGGATGVYTTAQNGSVWNAGSIIGDTNDGVYADGLNIVIENVGGGLIHGENAGIESAGDGATIVNEGTVSGSGNYGILLSHINPAFAAAAIAFPPGALTHVQNDGTVTGPVAGIEVQTNHNVEIDNTGLINSANFGIDVQAVEVQLTAINNLGTIEGDTASINATTAVAISNGKTGVLEGDVVLGGTGDSIENYGAIYGNVNLGAGNDTYHNRADGFASGSIDGGDGNDRLFGARDDDVLLGGAGNDVIKGGIGDDVLTGGIGLDKLYGGVGADTFVYTKTSESNSVSSDIIDDFSHAQGDLIDLSQVDASNAAGIQHFTFDGTTVVTAAGHLSYSVDASGTATLNGYFNNDATPDLVIKLSHVASLVASDFILS